QHFEIERGIGFQGLQNFLDVFPLDGDREVAPEFAHSNQVFRESFLKRSRDRSVDLLFLVEESHQRRRWRFESCNRGIHFRRLQSGLSRMASSGWTGVWFYAAL